MNDMRRCGRDGAGETTRVLLAAALVALAATVALPRASAAYQQQIEGAAGRVGEAMTHAGRKTVAVVDFTDLQGNVTELGRFLAEQLSVSLGSRGGAFETIDRNHLRALLQEHKLSATGLIDPLTARKVGEIAGAECLVSGSITPFSESVNLTIKLLDTRTAKILGGTTVDIPRTSTINELLAKGISTQSIADAAPTGSSGQAAQKGRSTSPGGQPVSFALQVQDANEFRFELKGCAAVGTTVTCRLMITNTGADRLLYLQRGGSRIIDPEGTEIAAKEVSLGGETFGSYYSSATLVSGIPMRAGVRFDGVSARTEKVPLLEFHLNTNVDITIQFRDVPLAR